MAEFCSMLLFDHGAVAVGEEQFDESSMTLIAGFDDLVALQAAERAIAHLSSNRSTRESPGSEADTWAQARRGWVQAVETKSWSIRPPWLPADPENHRPELVIDPGSAFGDAGHPTTRLVLDLLPSWLAEGSAVVDIGTGTGILSIAAARLGSRSFAIEIDEHAAQIAATNVQANDLEDSIDVHCGDASDAQLDAFDMALVNVTIDIHRSIASTLRSVPLVIVSGVLDHQVAEIVTCYSPRLIRQRVEADGWVAVVME